MHARWSWPILQPEGPQPIDSAPFLSVASVLEACSDSLKLSLGCLELTDDPSVGVVPLPVAVPVRASRVVNEDLAGSDEVSVALVDGEVEDGRRLRERFTAHGRHGNGAVARADHERAGCEVSRGDPRVIRRRERVLGRRDEALVPDLHVNEHGRAPFYGCANALRNQPHRLATAELVSS
jgi:hypothetical protein